MKLIIDIPDEVYNDINSLAKFPTYISPILRDIIKNGNVFSEEPERPQGEWIRTSLYGQTCYECYNCHLHYDLKTNYCPNCGAKMQKGGTK